MALFTYLDVSGTQELPAMAVACLIAPEDRWLDFERNWVAALASSGLSEFHMKDFAHSVNEFVAWKGNEPRRIALLKQLKFLIDKYTTKKILFSLFVHDFDSVNREFPVRECLGGPYAVLVAISLVSVLSWRLEAFPREEIACFVEEGDNYQGELFDLLRKIRDFDAPVTTLKKRWSQDGVVRYRVPFQACDFVAWELAKHTRMASDAGTQEVVARKSFKGVVPAFRSRWNRYIDRHALVDLCERLAVRRRKTQ